MANQLQLKRSAVPGKVPTTGDLTLGELAINTYDGKLYLKKDDGTPAVVEVGLLDTIVSLALGGTNAALSAIAGGILYSTASAMAITAVGTAGQALISNGASAPAWTTLTLENLPGAWVKKSVKVATTANITLSGTQTIDGVAVAVGDRVLVKNQTTVANNGIYVVAASTWARSADANAADEIAGGTVSVDQGTVNGGSAWTTSFLTTNTLGTTAMNWTRVFDLTQTLPVANGGTGATTLTGIVKGNGTSAMTAATAGTDYMHPGTTSLLTKGFTFTAYNIGTISSGTVTPAAANGNYQYYTNNGAHTLAAPAADCAIDIYVTNSASAGAITFSGFTVGSMTGSPLTTTSTHKFKISITRVNSIATYTIYALQ